MDGDQVYMDDFGAECYALYVADSTASLTSDRTVIWPLYEQRFCPFKVITDAESREYKRRLQTQYQTTDYVESMRTPMSRLLQQISNPKSLEKQEETNEAKGAWVERFVAWIDRKITKKRISLAQDKSQSSK